MAEKKQQQLTKSDIRNALAEDNPQRNSGLSIPMRMESDTLPQSQPDHTYRFALNAVIEDRTDIGMVRTEESNEVAFNLNEVFNPKSTMHGIEVNVYLQLYISGIGYNDAIFIEGARYSSKSDFDAEKDDIKLWLENYSSPDFQITEYRVNEFYHLNLIQAKNQIDEYKNYKIYVYAIALNQVYIPTDIETTGNIGESLSWTRIDPKVGDTISSSTYSSIELSDFVNNGYQLNTDTTKPFAEIKTKSGSMQLYDDDTYTISGLETSITWFVESSWDKCDLYAVPDNYTGCDTISSLIVDERLSMYYNIPVGTSSIIYIKLTGDYEPQLWMKEVEVFCNGEKLTKVTSTDDLADGCFYYGGGIYMLVQTIPQDMMILSFKMSYYDYSKDIVFVNDRQLADPIITVNSNYRQFKCTMTGGNANGITFRYRFDDSGEWQTIGYNTLTYYPANVSKVSVYAVKEGWNNSNTVEENL